MIKDLGRAQCLYTTQMRLALYAVGNGQLYKILNMLSQNRSRHVSHDIVISLNFLDTKFFLSYRFKETRVLGTLNPKTQDCTPLEKPGNDGQKYSEARRHGPHGRRMCLEALMHRHHYAMNRKHLHWKHCTKIETFGNMTAGSTVARC